MADKYATRRRGYGALVALCAAALPAEAGAQTAPIDRIEAIERQIRGLQGELQHLKSELGEAKQQLRQSRSEAQRSQEELRQAREAATSTTGAHSGPRLPRSQATQAAAPGESSRCALHPPP